MVGLESQQGTHKDEGTFVGVKDVGENRGVGGRAGHDVGLNDDIVGERGRRRVRLEQDVDTMQRVNAGPDGQQDDIGDEQDADIEEQGRGMNADDLNHVSIR